MDSIFVGQMVGAAQMGAVSVSYPFTLINAGSAAMLGVGSASVLSRAIGKKMKERSKDYGKFGGNGTFIVSNLYHCRNGVYPSAFISCWSKR